MRSALLAFLVSAVVSGALLAIVPSAWAGAYVMRNCNPPDGGAVVPGGSLGSWTGFGAPAIGGLDASCSGGGADTFGVFGDHLQLGSQAGFQLTVPSDSSIELRRVKAWWSVPPSSGGAATTPWVENNGAVVPSTGGHDLAAPDDLPLTGKVLKLESSCGFNVLSNCTFAGTGSPIVTILGTEVTLTESTPPVASIAGSPLLDGRVHSGTQPLGYDVVDADSGVSSVAVELNGTMVASKSFEGDPNTCPHITFTACLPEETGVLSVDTTKVPDGVYSLALVVADAAGNVGTASNISTIPTPARVTVRNAPSPPKSPATPAKPSAAHWRVRLRVSPHVVRNGRSVLFRGTILNRPLESGKNAIVQVRQGNHWRPFATPVASASGAFHVRQRFTQSKGQRLVFRAVVPKEKGYPYATGSSTSVIVRVR
ncbi:MAG TPA: hypothetical protein VHZ75_11340 [Solirubrobacteraceae bacterium]|nr:hypothetical protein [Solirubrobacteraceae bacterium]